MCLLGNGGIVELKNKIQNYYFLIVGVFSIFFAFSHAWNGNTNFFPSLGAANLAIDTTTTIFYVWHIITLENLVFGLAFIFMSFHKDPSKVKFTAWSIAAVMIGRLIVIVGSTILNNPSGLKNLIVDSIAILIFISLIVMGIRAKGK